MSETLHRPIWCCGCSAEVQARLTDGLEVRPAYPQEAGLPFWRCDTCGNFVECLYRTKDRTRPRGNIPTPELKQARLHISSLLDPMWKTRGEAANWTEQRRVLYSAISERIGREFHVGEIKTIEEAREAYRIIREISRG